MGLVRTLKSGDTMVVGSRKVKFCYADNEAAICRIDYGDGSEVDEIEIDRDTWFDLDSRQFVASGAINRSHATFGVLQDGMLLRKVVQLSFEAPRSVLIYPDAF
jgi:hypothetical protein